MISDKLLNIMGNRIEIFNAKGPCPTLFISKLFRTCGKNILVITESTQKAIQLTEELGCLNPGCNLLKFPDYETLPYDIFSPQQDLISDRLEALYCLKSGLKCITVTPISAALTRISPAEYVMSSALVLKKGQHMSMTALANLLTQNGYSRVSQVYSSGEFAVRGSLIDLYPSGTDSPYRIDFFDDEVDSIRVFDTETQRTTERTDQIRLLPAREFPIQQQDIERFRRKYREKFGSSLDHDSVYQQVSTGHIPSGIEYYLPLFFDQTVSLLDYLSSDTAVVLLPDTVRKADEFLEQVQQRFCSKNIAGSDPELRPRLEPCEIFHKTDEFLHLLKKFTRVVLKKEDSSDPKDKRFNVENLPEINIRTRTGDLKDLNSFITSSKESFRFLFSVYSPGRLETLNELIAKIGIRPKHFKTFEEFEASSEKFGSVVSPVDEGLAFNETGIILITETEIFGNSYVNAKRNNKNVQVDAIIRNLAELKIGDKIVHYKYGIGCYQGLEIREINGVNKEFFCLEYADNAKLYVEITELHLISRYTGGSNPKLNTLGSDSWEKNRKKTQEKVKDVAVQLLDVYSKRAVKTGFAFKFDRKAYNEFAAGFPYEETEDQKRAIESVIHDMTSSKTMDRLICGDVGFGKTEVAIRAAYIAASNSKQVAVLVPTVLLAEQHYESFKNRFAGEAVNIEVLSRFKTQSQQKKILEDVTCGKVDIVIGTHTLLSQKVEFRDLGLLIVDEEHRFGVRQKEKIKALRSDVDILTLTATPIPRTLNMAFSGLRDLSLITTPPAKRLSIKTFLNQNDSTLIREAVLRELKRGGQVYYLHNETQTIEKRAEDLANLIPEARIEVAHGQMNERDLAAIMNRFYHHKFNVLVCTTIIETGLDIPAANTIIIERADKFGLAQLHQIRGRVGRSSQQAYAYLLTPPQKLITKDAIKRLEAISKNDDLGVGFTLANHDLEIRGAGELLGDEQSGQIATVGFTLYMEMLGNAIKALKEGEEPALVDLTRRNTEINLNIAAVIPKEYLGDISTRLSFYKRLSSSETYDSLSDIREEMIDRYGPVPQEVKNLIEVNRIRIDATSMGITGITVSKVTSFIRFGRNNRVKPEKIVMLLQRNPNDFKMADGDRIKLLKKVEPDDTIKYIRDLLDALM
jgi:transcription-repair coupling factor (superfamily II helicase)